MVRAMALAAGVLLASRAAASQELPPASTELVRLDVVVTDGDGRPIRDLTRDDFLVLEDGKPQRVTHFLPAGHPAAVAASPAGAAAPAAEASAAAEARLPAAVARTVVVLVDDLHIGPGNMEPVKQGLRRMLDEVTGAEDRVALVTTGGGVLAQPTVDRAALRGAVARLTARPMQVMPAANSEMTAAQAEMILAGDRIALALAAETIMAQPGTLMPVASPEARRRVAEEEALRQARGLLAESLRFSSATLRMVIDVLATLAAQPGRKVCLLVSDGFLMGTGTADDRREDLRHIMDASMRSGSVVYALDSRGLVTGMPDATATTLNIPPGLKPSVERRGEQIAQDSLALVAEETGGFMVRGGNDLGAGLRRMLEDNDAYYLIAYEPANTRRDGRFRRVEVKLPGRRGLLVRTRKGYIAPDDRKLAARARVAAAPATATASAAYGPARGLEEADARVLLERATAGTIPVHLTAGWFDLPPASPQAVVRAHLDVSGLPWQDADGHRKATLEIVGGLYDADGQPAGAPFGKRAALDFDAARYERVSRSGLDYREMLALRPGRYEVRVVVREPQGGLRGGASQWLEVPDLAGGGLALSSLFLSASPITGEAAAAAAEPLSEASSLSRFRSGETLYFQVYVYNAARDEKQAADVVLQAQVSRDGKLIAASRPQPAALQRKNGVPVPETNGMPLQGLAAGTYELRVVVVDRKADVTASRVVAFTVE